MSGEEGVESKAEEELKSGLNDLKANQFHEDGYLVMRGCFEDSVIEKLHAKAMGNFYECLDVIGKNGHSMGIGVKHCFKEIVQRHLNRYEMTYNMGDEEFAIVPKCEQIMGTVKAILGDDCVVINKSVVVSKPGAETQAWHSDGPHLDITKDLPCHCLNVFVPLVDVDETNGPTEMRPGSVSLTRNLKKAYMKAFLTKKLRAVDAPNLTKGDILMFDYRILHRGKANNSPDQPRPVLVYTYAKPFYIDNMNFPKNSVHEPALASQGGEGEGEVQHTVFATGAAEEE